MSKRHRARGETGDRAELRYAVEKRPRERKERGSAAVSKQP